jgi:acetoin utilization deacetylase AcuC-like enzyme
MSIGIISHPDCLLHEMGRSHPEQPERLRVIEGELISLGIRADLKEYEAPLATREQLERVHTPEYVESIFLASPKQGLVSLDPDTWMNPYTLSAARRAAGAVIYGVDLVMSGELHAAFCNIRPPGHHAERAQAMGFCFFNNIAVGVAYALEHYKLKRVAIIDFDVHHGNGTENIFKNDDRVLLCSSFQHPFYPFSGAGTRNEHILNLPLPSGCTGRMFRDEIETHWLMKIKEFKPEMIFFSAGFDGHEKDVMANISLHEDDYAWITQKIKAIADEVCQGRIVSALEGGYALEILGRAAAAHIQALSIP